MGPGPRPFGVFIAVGLIAVVSELDECGGKEAEEEEILKKHLPQA